MPPGAGPGAAIFAGNTSGSVYRVLSHLARQVDGHRLVGIFPTAAIVMSTASSGLNQPRSGPNPSRSPTAPRSPSGPGQSRPAMRGVPRFSSNQTRPGPG